MTINISENLITVEEFEQLADWLHASGKHYELVEGKIVKKMPSKDWHTDIINIIIAYLKMHLITHNLPGITTSQTTGFRFSPYHCPEPDIAYISSMDHYADQHCITDYWPDLVVEVVSNPKSSEEINRLETDRVVWLERGATVWEVWAQDRLVKVFTDAEAEPDIEREKLTFASLPSLEIPLKVVFAKLEA
jgi:Uma2 family endonuclease